MFRRLAQPFVFVLVAVALATTSAAVQTTPPPPVPDQTAPFFDDTVLQEVRLAINNKDWNTLKTNYLANDYYPCDFKWGGITVRNVGIRSRGTGSRSGVKPGLRVDFDRYTTDQKFLGMKSFVLRNNVQDYSNMHERISMLFFRRMGLVPPREAHTKLYINNVYEGLYSIVESIDKDFLTRTYAENDGYLYKFDANPGDSPYYFIYGGPDASLYVPHPFKPETHESDPHPQPIVDMIRTVAEASDAVFRSQIAQFLDLTKVVKHVAIELFLGDNDGFTGNYGMNNFYLYRFQNQNLHTLIPWDKSEAFRDGPSYPILHNLNDVPDQNRNRLIVRALQSDDLRNLFYDTMLACAASLSELGVTEPPTVPPDSRSWMEREVDREYAQIKDAVLADPQKAYTNDQFNLAVEDLRVFARDRSAFVTSQVQAYRP
jgi:spore coat protein CotH